MPRTRCALREMLDEIGAEVDNANLKVEFVNVTSDRIPAVTGNKIDLECGSTTANAERSKVVAFSPLMLVAGLYNKWSVGRLPTGEKLNVAISPQLEEAFKPMEESPGGSN